jgi:hypothetical protein
MLRFSIPSTLYTGTTTTAQIQQLPQLWLLQEVAGQHHAGVDASGSPQDVALVRTGRACVRCFSLPSIHPGFLLTASQSHLTGLSTTSCRGWSESVGPPPGAAVWDRPRLGFIGHDLGVHVVLPVGSFSETHARQAGAGGSGSREWRRVKKSKHAVKNKPPYQRTLARQPAGVVVSGGCERWL